jgi:hypothetical protein
MDNKNLFKEAIADAKAVREAALANAKAALEEALTPKLQSMLAAKLNEMEYEEEGLEEGKDKEEMEEGMYPDQTTDPIQDRYRATGAALEEGDDELEEDFDLSEILAELEDDNLEEGEDKEEMNEAEDEEEGGEDEEEEQNVADMTIDDLKALIQDIVAQETGAEGGEEAGDMSMDMDMGGEEGGAEEDEVPLDEEEINLEELLAELDALDEADDKEEMDEAKKKAPKKEDKKEKEELKEAIATINALRSEINEVNLLNAKLLYVNKIFKAKNLSESQKLQVIASFDKATTAKEAKVVYESLNATLTAATAKKQIKESLGFASKAAGVAPKKAIVESNDVISRMQKLANIIK